MSGPTSNEVAEAPVEQPVSDTVAEVVANVPDTSEDTSVSFMDAIDAAFNQQVAPPARA